MGKVKESDLVKFFCGVIFNPEIDLNHIRQLVTKKFAEIDLELESISFNLTDYYTKEMGNNLSRAFFSFKQLRHVQEAPEIKLWTNDVEDQFSGSTGRRKVNLDPGYIELSKLVLLTTKNFSHRIYIGKGIYAEITLIFRNKTWEFLEWTYPDFRTEKYLEFFRKVRYIYRNQLNTGK